MVLLSDAGAAVAGTLGLALFVVGSWHQHVCHRILARLRGGAAPGVPRGAFCGRAAAVLRSFAAGWGQVCGARVVCARTLFLLRG